jgi:hypothetical protein
VTNEPRKASEVILKLEEKLDVALGLIRTLDLNIKILSNKLNSVQEALAKKADEAPKFTVEAVNNTRPPTPVFSQFQQNPVMDPEKQIPVEAEFRLPMEAEPKGFRRISRPETFAGDDAYLPANAAQVDKQLNANKPAPPPPGRGPVMVPPPGRTAEVVVPPAQTKKAAPETPKPAKQAKVPVSVVQNAIPVEQRVVNQHGKSMYLADVEIIDLSTMQPVFKTRTNGMGKWMASLGMGQYRVIIRRMEPTTKERMEVTQDIEVDGTQSPLTLPSIIVKPS